MVKFNTPKSNTFRDMNYFLVTFGKVQTPDRQTDRQTESDAYEPTVQIAQVGSIKEGKKQFGKQFSLNNNTEEQLSSCVGFQSYFLTVNETEAIMILYYVSASTQAPSPNAQVIFNTTFKDNYDATIKNMTAFIESYRNYFCTQTFKIDCARLTRPATAEDVVKENSKFTYNPTSFNFHSGNFYVAR